MKQAAPWRLQTKPLNAHSAIDHHQHCHAAQVALNKVLKAEIDWAGAIEAASNAETSTTQLVQDITLRAQAGTHASQSQSFCHLLDGASHSALDLALSVGAQ